MFLFKLGGVSALFLFEKNSACWFGVVGVLGFDSKGAQKSNSPLHSYR